MSRITLGQITLHRDKTISMTKKYYLLQPSSAAAPTTTNYGITPPIYTQTGYSGWSNTEPNYTVGDERVLYELSETIYSDNTWDYSTPTISSSYEAAKAAYDEAIQAEATLQEFTDLGLKQGYIWDNATYTAASGNVPEYPVGSYIASGILVGGNRTITRSNSNTYGLNTWISTGGINLRYNAINLMKLTTSNLEFYYPSTVSQQKKAISLGTNGTINSLVFYGFNSDNKAMELTNSGLSIYDSTGTTVQASFGGSQATVSGTINAYSGQFGTSSNNYWVIDTFYDANKQATYSSLHSKGQSFIQLGDNNTWTILTDKISSGWRYMSTNSEGITNPYYFRYKQFATNGTYYDYGVHIPSVLNTSDQKAKRLSDKFLFIRTANYVTDSNLGTLETDANWNYPFYVDSQGNVRATAFYIGASTTPIGGGAGTIAEKLSGPHGSATQPVYFDNSGVATNTTYTLNAAGAKGVITDFTDNTTSVDLPTTAAVVNYVTSRGYVTSSGVTSVTIAATSPVSSSTSSAQTGASVSTTISLASGYGDTQNPYASKTKNYVLAAPSNAAGVPSFRLLVASDIPDLSATYLTSHQTVTNKSATLAWGTSKTVATIGSTDITISLPSNPNTNTTYNFTGGTNKFTVTPSVGDAYDVTVTPSITNNVTGSGTSGSLAKWNGANTLTNGPAFTSGGTGFLKQDGTWETPYSLPIAKYNTLGGVKPAYSSTGAATLTTTAAANTTTPTIAAKTTTSGRYYAIEIDKNGVLFVNVPWTNVNSSYLTGITSNDVTTALGYTPYDSTNPNGYTTNTGTVTSVRVQASSPLQSSTSTAQSVSLNTTISFINQDANKVLAGPSSGTAAAPTFRSLVAADIPNLSWNKITSNKPTTLSGYGITDAAGLNAVTGVEISDAQLTITRADGTSTSTSVTITASQATGATKLIKIVNNVPQDAAAGSETLPVYFTGGYPQAVTSIAKLNGTTTTYPEFYAPTTAGTVNYVLASNGSGAPKWIPQSDISSGNTYTTTIATDNGTNQLTLAHGTKYKLTAGGTSFIFTMPSDTDEKLKVAAVGSGTTYYPIVGTGDAAATRQYDTTGLVYVGTNGTANGTNGNALFTLGNSTASTAANWKKGTLRLYGTTAYYTDMVSGAPSANRTITLPNKTGTVALTSDLTWDTITSKPTSTGSSTTNISIADHGTTSVGSASNWSAGSASTWEFENKTVATAASSATSIPNVTNAGSASTWSFADVTVPIRADSATAVPIAASSATACDDITSWNAGSGSATLSFSINGTETTNGNQLNISFSHSHTAPTLAYTARSITGVSGSTSIYGVKSGNNSTTTASKASGNNGTAPTLGPAISITGVGGTTTVSSKKSGSNSQVPSLTITSTTVVNGKSHSITDTGHSHTI